MKITQTGNTMPRAPASLVVAAVVAVGMRMVVCARAGGSPGVEQCHRYRGTIDAPIMGVIQTDTASGCEDACAARAGCYAFTFTPGTAQHNARTQHPPPPPPQQQQHGHHHRTEKPPNPQTVPDPRTPPTCTVFKNSSNIGGGNNLPGTPTMAVPSFQACCSLCTTTPACASWTWALSVHGAQTAPCWLHPQATKLTPSIGGAPWVAGISPPKPASCTVYNNSNIGAGANLPNTPTDEPSAGTCCDLCSATSACASWTWALGAPGNTHAPCWLHPKVGTPQQPSPNGLWVSGVQHKHAVASQGMCQLKSPPRPGQVGVNNGDSCPGPAAEKSCAKGGWKTSGLCGVDDARFDDPLHLVNSTGDYSGVPLGGVGVGFFDFAPDGEIKRVAINNAHQDGVLTDTSNGTFLAMWDGSAEQQEQQETGQSPHAACWDLLLRHSVASALPDSGFYLCVCLFALAEHPL